MLSSAKKRDEPLDYIETLNVDRRERAKFEKMFQSYFDQLKSPVSQDVRKPADSRSKETGEGTVAHRSARHSAERFDASQTSGQKTHGQPSLTASTQGTESFDRPAVPASKPITQSRYGPAIRPVKFPDRRSRAGSDASDLDTTAGGPSLIGAGRTLGLPPLAEDVREQLEMGFQVFTGSKLKSVFCRGSLVAVFWHENYGSKVPSKMARLPEMPPDGRLGPGWVSRIQNEVVYSHKRRFIIVNERSGFSVGIPITSYGGKGLTMKNLNREEQRAHTIVYALGRQPELLEGESPFTKRPICIDTRTSGETLSRSSRLYYSKPQSIDHNIKVKHLGQVIAQHIPVLLLDYSRENSVGTNLQQAPEE